jgi:hypothetical protein
MHQKPTTDNDETFPVGVRKKVKAEACGATGDLQKMEVPSVPQDVGGPARAKKLKRAKKVLAGIPFMDYVPLFNSKQLASSEKARHERLPKEVQLKLAIKQAKKKKKEEAKKE